MIDMELLLYNEIHEKLIDIADVELQTYEYDFTPKSDRPLVIVELANDRVARTVELNEVYSNRLTFTVNVFTNGEERLTKGKLICDVIDDIMITYGLKRVSRQRIPDFMHKDVCRYFMNYDAHITVDGIIY